MCLWVPVCMCLCVSVGAHIRTRTHTRIYAHTQEAAAIILWLSSSPRHSKTFSKTLTKTLDKMTDLCYDIFVIREGENLDDHSCTSCVLEDGDPSWLGFPFSFL